jgi:hypothetical protein
MSSVAGLYRRRRTNGRGTHYWPGRRYPLASGESATGHARGHGRCLGRLADAGSDAPLEGQRTAAQRGRESPGLDVDRWRHSNGLWARN